jgi:hypothetical protein
MLRSFFLRIIFFDQTFPMFLDIKKIQNVIGQASSKLASHWSASR